MRVHTNGAGGCKRHPRLCYHVWKPPQASRDGKRDRDTSHACSGLAKYKAPHEDALGPSLGKATAHLHSPPMGLVWAVNCLSFVSSGKSQTAN